MSDKEPTDLAPRPSNETSEIIRPQYMTGFEGMAVAPFEEKIRAVLAEAPDPAAVEIKPNGIVFLPGVWWRRQLTRAFQAGGWALAPRGPSRVMGQLVVWPGALFCLGRFVAEAVGECAYIASNNQMSYASAVEGAKTDCLTRCCKDLGMGTHLWDKAWRDRWLAEYAEQGKDGKWHHRSGRPVQDIDLMAGAGGAAPTPKEPSPKASPAPSPQASTDSSLNPSASGVPAASARSSAASASPKTTPTDGTTSADTGDAATAEQKLTLRGHVRRLGWKGHFAKMWLKGLFGFDSPDSLTVDQCLNACLLAEVFGTEKYKPLVEDLRKDGLIKAEAA